MSAALRLIRDTGGDDGGLPPLEAWELYQRGEIGYEHGIFGGNGSSGDAGGCAESSVRKAIVRAAHRAHQSGCGTEIGGGLGPGATVADRFSIGDEAEPGGCFLFIEDFVEEDDLAGDLFAAKRFEFVEIFDHNYVGDEAVGRRRSAAS